MRRRGRRCWRSSTLFSIWPSYTMSTTLFIATWWFSLSKPLHYCFKWLLAVRHTLTVSNEFSKTLKTASVVFTSTNGFIMCSSLTIMSRRLAQTAACIPRFSQGHHDSKTHLFLFLYPIIPNPVSFKYAILFILISNTTRFLVFLLFYPVHD